MHKTLAEAAEFVDALLPRIAGDPERRRPLPVLPRRSQRWSSARAAAPCGSPPRTCTRGAAGAFTGEVSAPMLVELDVDAVILGHSERRQLFGETDEALARKVPGGAGRRPRADPLRRRERGGARGRPDRGGAGAPAAGRPRRGRRRRTSPRSSSPTSRSGRSAPGAPPRPSRPRRRCAFIRDVAARFAAPPPTQIRILYGGSVKPDNAAELLAQPDVDGALVGGASLDPERLRRDRRSGGHGLTRADRLPRWRWSSSTAGGWPSPARATRSRSPRRRSSIASGRSSRTPSSPPRAATSACPTGQMGNSEVGHLNLGAGAIVKQDLARIDDAIADGSFFENEALLGGLRAGAQQPARAPAPARPGLRRRRPLRLGAPRGDDRAGLRRRASPTSSSTPSPTAATPLPARRPGVPRRARALAAAGGPRRNRQRPLLRDGPRHPLGADQARLRRDRPRRGPAGGQRRRRRSTPPMSAARPTSSSSRP